MNAINMSRNEFSCLEGFGHVKGIEGSSLVERLWKTAHDLRVPGSIPTVGDSYFAETKCFMDVG